MLVSVVMSIYKPNLKFLGEQLDSIDAQDIDDLEVIVYNDCPEDDRREAFCREHCTRHPLRYIHGKENRGYVKAFEFLVQQAQGAYLAFSDQDDIWLPGRIEKCLAPLEEGYLLVSCDRQVIDGEGKIEVESWRAAHPKAIENQWQTGERLLPQAVFTCFSIGMATMMRTDVARELIPYPTCTGHDKWLTMGADALGACAFVNQALVQYRRHGSNVSGTMSNITCKADWYERRTEPSFQLAQTFCGRFPDAPECDEVRAFAEARKQRDVLRIWKYRRIAPLVSYFEIVLKIVPEPLLKRLLNW